MEDVEAWRPRRQDARAEGGRAGCAAAAIFAGGFKHEEAKGKKTHEGEEDEDAGGMGRGVTGRRGDEVESKGIGYIVTRHGVSVESVE